MKNKNSTRKPLKSGVASGLPRVCGKAGIPVIDLFAGPGGLGEGFSAFAGDNGQRAFKIRLSIEKDPIAHQTLKLRAFFRQFPPDGVPDDYYKFLRREITMADLYYLHQAEAGLAETEAWHCTLSKENATIVRERIANALGSTDRWVLIGGPPCQAYSLAGRSRNMGMEDYDLATDSRLKLYIDYLQVIDDHAPAVFVMENVKGLLSAKVNEARIFEKILEDLQSPHRALRAEGRAVVSGRQPHYNLFSLNPEASPSGPEVALPQNYVIRAERHGVPQARHRLIIIGVRSDLKVSPDPLPSISDPIPAKKVLTGLPPLRSGISGNLDSAERWLAGLRETAGHRWLKSAAHADIGDEMLSQLPVVAPEAGCGAEFISTVIKIDYARKWFLDSRIKGVCNHSARSHMESDLHRYFFAACFARLHDRTPSLADFPKHLLPAHQNVQEALETGHFSDRFRVQLPDRPSTTITSHISKDGHYYIHYDPGQCRSLTVREAARLQTFPDNYFFCGGRTSQYTQVGNAVPPLLAREIAHQIYNIIR